MIEVMNAHTLTMMAMFFIIGMTPFYWFLILPSHKATKLAWLTTFFMSIAITANINKVFLKLSPSILLSFLWLLPIIFISRYRTWFAPLNMKALIGIQSIRILAGLFLVEMVRCTMSPSFAIPVAAGDVFVGLLALHLIRKYETPPTWGVAVVTALGAIDILLALLLTMGCAPCGTMGFASQVHHYINLFPTGILPTFIAPYFLSYHYLAWINLPNNK